MIEIKSEKGTQVVEVSGTGAGVKIKCVDRTRRSLSVHIFSECVEDLIKAPQTITEKSKVTGADKDGK